MASAFLSRFNYYRLSGYCLPFEASRHRFHENVRLANLQGSAELAHHTKNHAMEASWGRGLFRLFSTKRQRIPAADADVGSFRHISNVLREHGQSPIPTALQGNPSWPPLLERAFTAEESIFFPRFYALVPPLPTISISFPKLVTTSYLTCSGSILRLTSAKNLRAHSILVCSIGRSSMLDMEPFVSATK